MMLLLLGETPHCAFLTALAKTWKKSRKKMDPVGADSKFLARIFYEIIANVVYFTFQKIERCPPYMC